jgi:hypothetical protein
LDILRLNQERLHLYQSQHQRPLNHMSLCSQHLPASLKTRDLQRRNPGLYLFRQEPESPGPLLQRPQDHLDPSQRRLLEIVSSNIPLRCQSRHRRGIIRIEGHGRPQAKRPRGSTHSGTRQVLSTPQDISKMSTRPTNTDQRTRMGAVRELTATKRECGIQQ